MKLLMKKTMATCVKANSLEAAAEEANERAEKMEEKQRQFQKKLNEKVRAIVIIEK